jgi:hypothetical protein
MNRQDVFFESNEEAVHPRGQYEDKWRAWGDSNARPLVPETSALSS